MNFFFSINTKSLSSKLSIPKFRNNSSSNKNYSVFSAEILKNRWEIKKIETEFNNDFFLLEGEVLNNEKIFFLAKDNEIKSFEANNNELLVDLNNFTNTIPDFRANLLIQNKQGGFSSYQSDYPFSMVSKMGNIMSPISTLTNIDAEENLLIFKNIYIKPIIKKFKLFFIDIFEKKVLYKKTIFTNTTNIINIEKKFINSNVFLFSSQYIGIPMFISILKNNISFEHTHPPHEYILGKNKFKIVKEIKEDFNEIIIKENS